MQCAAPRRRASSSRPGAVSCGCKTCHCARRQPYISRWTSEAAAVDLQLTVCPAVGPRWHWRAKKAKHKSAGNQPAGWTATSTARPAEVWKGARDTVDCDEQQHVELSTNDNRHGLKMVPTGAVWRRCGTAAKKPRQSRAADRCDDVVRLRACCACLSGCWLLWVHPCIGDAAQGRPRY